MLLVSILELHGTTALSMSNKACATKIAKFWQFTIPIPKVSDQIGLFATQKIGL